MKISKTIKVGLASTLCLGLLPMINMADNVNNTYQQQLDEYNQVVQDNKDKKSKYEAEMQKYQEDMIKYQEDVKAYEQALADNTKKEQENQAMKEQYDKDVLKYEQDKAEYDKIIADNNAKYQEALNKYNAAKAEYDKIIAQMEADKDKPGHLSQAVGQGLQFGKDPNARLSISGGTLTTDIAAPKDVVTDNGAHKPNVGRRISKGEQVVATYTNLSNLSYAGKPIAKMVNTFSLDQLNGQNEMNLFVYNDPTDGFYVENLPSFWQANDPTLNGASALRCQTKFYYADGTQVEFSKEYPAVVSVASLNNNLKPAKGIAWREEVINYNFEFVPITASIVSAHGNKGPIYANEYTNEGNGSGNAFDTGAYGNWDLTTSPDFWRVAGSGVLKSGNVIDYTIYAHGMNQNSLNSGGQWTGYSTAVANNVLPVVPPKPELPANPIAPILPPKPQYHNIVAPTKPVPPTKPVEPTYAKEVKPTAPQPPVVETPKTGVGSKIAITTSIIGIAVVSLILIKRNKQA